MSIRKSEGKTETQSKETVAKGGQPSYANEKCSTCGRWAHKAGVKYWGTTNKCNKCGQVRHWSVVCTSLKLVEDESVKECDSTSDENIFIVSDSIINKPVEGSKIPKSKVVMKIRG